MVKFATRGVVAVGMEGKQACTRLCVHQFNTRTAAAKTDPIAKTFERTTVHWFNRHQVHTAACVQYVTLP